MWEVCSIVILTLNMMNSDKIRSFAFMIWPSLQSSFIVFPPHDIAFLRKEQSRCTVTWQPCQMARFPSAGNWVSNVSSFAGDNFL